MKSISDFYQFAITGNDWLTWLVVALTALAILQGWKLVRVSVRVVWLFCQAAFVKFNRANLLGLLFLIGCLWLGRYQIADLLQYLEPAVYAGQYGSVDDEHQALIFEQELCLRNPDKSVTDEVKRVTVETANTLGCPRSWIYACAASECGLKPFTVRDDRIAASWAQLTTAGLTGIKIDGRQATLEADVIPACQRRDIKTVMAFSRAYLVDRWLLKGSPAIARPVDVYLLLFAPGMVGRPLDAVLYEGYKNPNYYKNSGLDGWCELPSGRIIRQPSLIDGKITVAELGRIQEFKKNELLKKYIQ